MADVKPRVKARYFCEACGAEVRAGASSCPSCGSVFTAVRCPECGYEGRAPEFLSGCPVCGYRTKSQDAASAEPTGGTGSRKPGLSAGFYRAAVVVLAALILGLVVLLVLRA
jgi:hypothetical protein